jgi:hypothetical protein
VKFSEILLFYSGTRPTLSGFASNPAGWTVNGSAFNGGVYLVGSAIATNNTLNFEFTKPNGNTFIDAGESIQFTFTATAGNAPFVITGVGAHAQGGPNDASQRIQFGCTAGQGCTSVPEPSSVLLMASGLLGMGVIARRRRNEA